MKEKIRSAVLRLQMYADLQVQKGLIRHRTAFGLSYGKTKRGFETVECNRCRTVCPMGFGIRKGKEKV
ncbi:hypothetical protein [Lacrimispora defluvii]|uniref:4Fe-4S ferredoxin-type domain-containing protein n=1 Tax=Lacrimispora defluvii TaxID=2719233 RepID=A0ABX1VTK8_9FIRM|nr:hypothetical protein [Lacrimispora defluvii]NNJ31713.1 hypothetical protein [Lacrimispora defluvii]